MPSTWLSRLFFIAVAALGIAGVASGSGCTRWGKPGPIPPTVTPLSSINVNPSTGSDTTGNGSAAKPYKTFTKAVAVLAASKSIAQGGVTIFLASGDYSSASGEKFPIVVPTNVTIDGTNFGMGPGSGSFINGIGQDTTLEAVVHAPAKTFYTALEVVPPANVNLNGLYVGASAVSLPNRRAGYSAIDILGTVNATDTAFAAGTVSRLRNIGGALVAGGSLTCSSCQIVGNEFGIGAFAVPAPTASPSSGIPSVTLMHATVDSTIAAKFVDVLTDGSANVTASGETFELGEFAYSDALRGVIVVPLRGAVDFGGGTANSTGGNVFLGAGISEIAVTRRSATISALDNTWNPNQQRANRNGQYRRRIVFASGASGKNVTIPLKAVGSTVTVGPATVPTPPPSTSPSPTTSPT